MWKIICAILGIVSIMMGVHIYRQYQFIRAYKDLSTVSDDLIRIQEDNLQKQERVIKLQERLLSDLSD